MKKILVVSEVFWPEVFLINDLVCQLKEKGYKVDILTQHPSYPYGRVYDGYENNDYSIEEWDGSTIYRFKVIEGYKESSLKKLLNYFYFAYKGKKIVCSLSTKYDVVLVSQTGPLTVTLPGISYARKFGVKLFVWSLDIWPDAVYSYGFKKNIVLDCFLNRFISYVYSSCDKIFVSSKQFINSLKPYAKDKDFYYMPNWMSISEDVQSSIRLDGSKFNITFTGNVSLYQNLSNVVRGFKLADINNCILNIVGDGSDIDNLKMIVEQEKIDNVVFHGRHPANEMHDVLTQSDALLLSLISDEGIQKTEPLKLQSYLRSGKPILGVIGGSGREIIEKYNLGLCAHPDDIAEIATTFTEIIAFSKTNQDSVANNANNLMNTRFNRESIFNNFVKHL